jgi:hypothetical protein
VETLLEEPERAHGAQDEAKGMSPNHMAPLPAVVLTQACEGVGLSERALPCPAGTVLHEGGGTESEGRGEAGHDRGPRSVVAMPLVCWSGRPLDHDNPRTPACCRQRGMYRMPHALASDNRVPDKLW